MPTVQRPNTSGLSTTAVPSDDAGEAATCTLWVPHSNAFFVSVLVQQAMWHAGKTQNELPPAELQEVDVSDLEHSTGSSTNGSSVINDDTAAAHSEAHSGAADNDSGNLSPFAMPVTLPANVREEFYGDLCKLCQSLALALPFTQDELQGLSLDARCVHC